MACPKDNGCTQSFALEEFRYAPGLAYKVYQMVGDLIIAKESHTAKALRLSGKTGCHALDSRRAVRTPRTQVGVFRIGTLIYFRQ